VFTTDSNIPVNALVADNSNSDVIYLLVVQAVTNCVLYGFLICVQSYSCLPYGTTVYHLTVTLTNIANPILCLILQFGCMPKPTRNLVTGLTLVGMFLSSYAALTAFMSPDPPFVGTFHGEIILVNTSITLQILTFLYIIYYPQVHYCDPLLFRS